MMTVVINRYILPVMILLSVNQAIPRPGRPEHVTVVSDVNNIGVQWEPPTETYGNIRSYIVSWAILPNFTDISSIVDGDVTMSIISARGQAGRLFRIRIRAENAGGIGPFSLPKYVRIKCGRDYSLFPGHNITVTSPGAQQGDSLRPGVLCSWNITTIPKYSLEITFNEIDMTENFPEECSNNYIEISGIGRLCNNTNTNKLVRTDLRAVNLILRTGKLVGIKGFRIMFKSVVLLPGPPTNVQLRTSDHAILITWRAPRENTLDITSYRIAYRVVSRISRFLVTVGHNMRQFAINTNKFEGKLVEIYLSAVIGTVEGTVSKKLIARAPCLRRISLKEADNVNITSPGYPNSYPSNIICTWFITSGSHVTSPMSITYLDFQLEDTSFCSNDYVTFSFKENTEHECSTMKTPKRIQTNARNFTVTLVTDSQNEFKGFSIGIKTQANVKATEKHVIGKLTTTTNFINTVKPVTTKHTTKAKFFSSTNVVSLLQNNMTSSKIEKVTTAPATHMNTAVRVLIDTTREQFFSKKNISRQLTEEKFDMLTTTLSAHAYTYTSTIKEEVLTHDHENIVQNTTLENDSYIYAAEPFTANIDGKSETPDELGSKDDSDHEVLLAVLLSTISCIAVLLLATCYFKWRRRHERMKINVEPSRRYRSTNIEMHDILRKQPRAGSIVSNSHACVSETNVQTVPARRLLETIPEYPEEFEQKENVKTTQRKRCHSFPFCLSVRRRKVHREVQNALKSFSFIDDQQTLEKTLVRRMRLQRLNSF